MEFSGLTWHGTSVALAIVLGPLGCVVSIMFAARVDYRDNWRRPMVVTAVLGAAAVLAAYFTGERVLSANPDLGNNGQVVDHTGYADRLPLPTVGWLAVALVTGWVNPRTGALRVMLPFLLTGFALIVLVLVVLAGQDGPRALWERIAEDVG
jgi:H+/Cl- antiporter ClcA